MSSKDFIESVGLPLLAHRLRRVSDEIVRDVGAVLTNRGLRIPPRAASLVMLLQQSGELPVMVAAQRLRLSHPMVINLARCLRDAGLTEDFVDPSDSRRRLLRLTDEGRAQGVFLVELNDALATAFQAMFDEAGADLFGAMCGFERAAAHRSVMERVTASLDRKTKRRSRRE